MKHRPGRGSELTPDERREIQRLGIVESLSIAEIARRTERDRGTVASVLQASDSQAYRQQFEGDEREAVQRLLRASSRQVARDWVVAASNAAARGDHRAARDLLLHSRLIDPVADSDSGATKIAIVIGTDEHPMRLTSPLALLREGEDEGHGSR